MENQNQVANQKPQNLMSQTLDRIQSLTATKGIELPKDYSVSNAVQSAWLILQDTKDLQKNPVLQSCTRESIEQAVFNMAIQGLNPAKRQCSFIAYGNKLTLQREYQGSIALAKRAGLKSVVANPIWKGDVFKYEVNKETGTKTIIEHTQDFMNLGGEVVGAYAIVEMKDGSKNLEVMSMNQIRQAWNQGATKGQSPAHKNFPDQMACKTVINRALKTIINSSDDSYLIDDEDEQQPIETVQIAAAKQEVVDQSNKGEEIGFDEGYEGEDLSVQNAEVVDSEAEVKHEVKQAVPF